MRLLSERETIAKAVAGDRVAFRQLVEQHQGFAYSLAFRLTGCRADAEDMVQEAFIKLWRNISSFKKEMKLRTWLYTIVTNCCLDFLRSGHGKQRRIQSDLTAASMVGVVVTPETSLNHNELLTIILAIAETLTPKQRAVFVLRDLEMLEVSEISKILSMSPGNIKSNLYYARCAVGDRLKHHYREAEKRTI